MNLPYWCSPHTWTCHIGVPHTHMSLPYWRSPHTGTCHIGVPHTHESSILANLNINLPDINNKRLTPRNHSENNFVNIETQKSLFRYHNHVDQDISTPSWMRRSVSSVTDRIFADCMGNVKQTGFIQIGAWDHAFILFTIKTPMKKHSFPKIVKAKRMNSSYGGEFTHWMKKPIRSS